MPSDKSRIKIINIGTASLLVVFFTLCMTAFAVLSLSAAQNDYSFSEKLAERTTEYYQANNAAQQKLAAVETLLEEHADASPKELSQLLEPYGISCDGDVLSWQTPVNTSQILAVELEVADDLRILRWQVVNTTEWTGSQTLNLIPIPDESEE